MDFTDNIKVLLRLIGKKQDRLSAISRRLAAIKVASQEALLANDVAAIDSYQKEVDELGEEVKLLTTQILAMRAEVNSFYRPACVA